MSWLLFLSYIFFVYLCLLGTSVVGVDFLGKLLLPPHPQLVYRIPRQTNFVFRVQLGINSSEVFALSEQTHMRLAAFRKPRLPPRFTDLRYGDASSQDEQPSRPQRCQQFIHCTRQVVASSNELQHIHRQYNIELVSVALWHGVSLDIEFHELDIRHTGTTFSRAFQPNGGNVHGYDTRKSLGQLLGEYPVRASQLEDAKLCGFAELSRYLLEQDPVPVARPRSLKIPLLDRVRVVHRTLRIIQQP